MKIQGFQAAQNVASFNAASSKGLAHLGPTAVASGGGDVYSSERVGRARDIMTGQDLTNISRNELKALTDKLYDAGVITGEQRLDLTAPYVDQLNAQMHSVANPDEKRNLLADLMATLGAAKRLRPQDKR